MAQPEPIAPEHGAPQTGKAPQPVGRTAFDRWLWERGISNIAAAAVLQCAVESVRRYRLPITDRDYRAPRPETIRRVVEWTEGAVGLADFAADRTTRKARAAAQPEAAQ